MCIKKAVINDYSFFCGKSRIRTCEGFPTDLQSVLVGRLSIFPTLAEKEGFEPPDLLQSTVFKTAAFDHSAISPLQYVFLNLRVQI